MIGIGSGTIEADPAQLDTAALLAAHVAASLDAAAALDRERQSAVTDPLTGILNRRGLEEHLERVLAASQEGRAPLSLLVFDCDDFKEINDRAGHGFGDSLLVEIAHVLGGRSRMAPRLRARAATSSWSCSRTPALTSRWRSETAAGVLREGLTDAGFPLRISGGIAAYPFDGASGSMLIRAADQALHVAKAQGKDRIASFAGLVRSEQARVTVEPGPCVRSSVERVPGAVTPQCSPRPWQRPPRSSSNGRRRACATACASRSSSWSARRAAWPHG